MTQPSDRSKRPSSRPPRAKGYRAERSPRSVYQSQPRTIDYTCRRCRLVLASGPLPTDPDALPIYPLPEGWHLGSELAPAEVGEGEDVCLCAACSSDVARGFPVDLRDLGRRS